jgi:hypothetical protein
MDNDPGEPAMEDNDMDDEEDDELDSDDDDDDDDDPEEPAMEDEDAELYSDDDDDDAELDSDDGDDFYGDDDDDDRLYAYLEERRRFQTESLELIPHLLEQLYTLRFASAEFDEHEFKRVSWRLRHHVVDETLFFYYRAYMGGWPSASGNATLQHSRRG